MKERLIRILCCLASLGGAAQADLRFIRHLDSLGLREEHAAYLGKLQQDDSAAYHQAGYYARYFNDSLFLEHYSKAPGLCESDGDLVRRASLAMLGEGPAALRDQWFSTRAGQRFSDLYKIHLAAADPLSFRAGDFPGSLQKSFAQYRQISRKSPFLASVMSAAVPGLGKLYAGKPGSAGLALLIHCAYAAQTWESADRLGVKHPLTLVNAAAFGVFYFANVYGSYLGVMQLKKERKRQFLFNAAAYYH